MVQVLRLCSHIILNMRRPFLLLLLLSSTVTLFAQNKLPEALPTPPQAAWTALGSNFIRYFSTHAAQPLRLENRIPDSLYQQWRTSEVVEDDEHPTKYLIIITLDGMRWQEIFMGADSMLWQESNQNTDVSPSTENFWCSTQADRREQLFPFLWKNLATNGQIYGNRNLSSAVAVTNKMRISYPGYNEIFSGHPDDQHIKLNFKIPNPNQHVLRFIGQCRAFRGRVASFGSWDVFPSIFNVKQGGMLVNAAFEPMLDMRFNKLNELLKSVSKPWGKRVRPDSITMAYAMQYLQTDVPRVLHIGLGETDEYAHEKKYLDYLQAAHASDRMIGELWDFIQSSPRYRDKTTLFITTDHGRGRSTNTWHKHHTLVDGSEQIWFAVMGPETPALGEMKNHTPYFQCQFAQTFAAFLGLDFHPEKGTGNKIPALFGGEIRQITQR